MGSSDAIRGLTLFLGAGFPGVSESMLIGVVLFKEGLRRAFEFNLNLFLARVTLTLGVTSFIPLLPVASALGTTSDILGGRS